MFAFAMRKGECSFPKQTCETWAQARRGPASQLVLQRPHGGRTKHMPGTRVVSK